MKAYLEELNDIQRQAVTTVNGPVLVVAGPGSGKTRVLTYRIAHLIEEGIAPWEILALTFTNKAAKEMKTRIAGVVGDKAKSVWAGTFHSIFARILRVEAEKIGFDSNFTIYDTEDSKTMIKAIIKGLNLDKDAYNVNGVRSRISSAKSQLIPPKAYVNDETLRKQDKMSKRPMFYKIYEEYIARCKRAGAMDFDDLLYQLYILLHQNKENVLEKYQQKFKYLLVDEFQDTNYLQYAIIKKLVRYSGSPENICIVGDDAQSIYAFRGATIENILNFQKDFKTLQTFKLEQNYRSTEHIVQAANEVIKHNSKQIPKKIWSNKGAGEKIKVMRCLTDTEEGKRVADAIAEHRNRYHFYNKEIAILYRTNSQSRIFEEYLRKYNILYRVFGGQSFYQRKEIKDLIAYLRLAVNPKDEEAFRRVVNFPKRGIGGTTVEKISKLAGETNRTMWECINEVEVSKRAKNSLKDFQSMVKVFGKRLDTNNAYELAAYISRQAGLLDLLKKDTTVEGLSRLENLNALLDGIKDFVEDDEVSDEMANDKSLVSYLQNIALYTDADDKKKDGDFVTLMSVHAAKGLEFKSVFVVGLEEQLFPSFMSMESEEDINEERRLFYVAITRAEQMLTLSFANGRYKFGQMRYNKPSRFLEEVGIQHLDSPGGTLNKLETATNGRTSSGVIGNFRGKRPQSNLPKIDPATFRPSPGATIKVGMKVLHMKFGEGEVTSIDGRIDNRVATIFFKGIDTPQRRLMLKFAKLQILN